MTRIHIDYETRSNVDLKTATTHVYALDDSTDVWCMAYAIDEEPVKLWKMGEPFPQDILDAVKKDPKAVFVAHNAHFELTIWNYLCVPRYGWPKLPAHRIECTMAMAFAMSLPGSLENAANATGLEAKKDLEGRRLMIQMASPRRVNPDGTFLWWEDPTRLERLYAYCINDVVVERALEKRLQPLSPEERKIWLLDWEINDRGIQVDIPNIKKAMATVDSEKIRLNTAIHKASSGMVKGTSDLTGINDYIRFSGLKMDGLAKADIRKTLGAIEDRPDLHAVGEILRLRQEGAKSSTAKLKAMLLSASSDQRIRGTMQYHGAGTGRWAGRKIQPHNMPRGELDLSPKEQADAVANIDRPDYITAMYGPPMTVLSDCLRAFIRAQIGHDFIVADFSAIEARVLAWLAGQDDVLEIFRSGRDIYKVAASDIFNVSYDEITKNQRAVGKVAVLALGYQGGIGAFMTMAAGYGVDMSVAYPELIKRATQKHIDKANAMFKQYVRKWCTNAKAFSKEIWTELSIHGLQELVKTDPDIASYETIIASDLTKQLWREANPITVQYWNELDKASMAAVREPKVWHHVAIPGPRHRWVSFI